MLIKIGQYEFTECWDGVLYKKLSTYPQISQWELQTIFDFMKYESDNGRKCRIEADDEGRLFLPEDFGIIVIGDEDGAQGLCSLKQIESGKGRKVYRSEGLRVDDSPLFLSGIFGITVEDVQAVLLEEDGEDEISIQMLTVQCHGRAYGVR